MNLASTLFALLLGAAVTASAQPVGSASEQSIKAAYLYKLADYVEWPSRALTRPQSPMTIGVLGDDSLVVELRAITRGRTVNGRPIRVRKVEVGGTLEGEHMLFVGASAMDDLGRLRDAARSHATLVVTETDDGLAQGSVINFRTVDQRIRFEVSLDSADSSDLKLSSRLLAVAERVDPRSR